MTTRGPNPFALLFGGAVLGAVVGWLASREPTKSPTLLEQLRAMDIAKRTEALADWRRMHPDVPRTIEFPEIATDPVLWDFTDHAVLRGLERTWTWGEAGYALMTSASPCILQVAAPAASGGQP